MQVILASHDKDGLGCIISPSNYMASGERCDSCLQGTRCSKEIKNRPSVSLTGKTRIDSTALKTK